MKLLTKDVIESIPKLFETQGIEDKLCMVKLFNPTGIGTWYIVEYDPISKEAFGYVDLEYYPELGAFNLTELEAYRGEFGIPIERDLGFRPTKWSEIKRTL